MAIANRKWILIVDPDKERRKVITDLLSANELGYRVIEAKDYTEANIKIANQTFDAIVGEAIPKSGPGFVDFYIYITTQKELKVQPEYLCYTDNTAFILRLDLKEKVTFLGALKNPIRILEHLKTIWTVKPTASAIDVTFINPFINSTLGWINQEIGKLAKKNKIYLKKEEKGLAGDISMIVGVSNARFNGSLAFSFQSASFLPLASHVLGEKKLTLDDDSDAVAGEIAEQILTSAVAAFKKSGLDVALSPTKILRGPNHQIKHVINGLCIGVTFQLDDGWFLVETIIQPLNPATQTTGKANG